MSTKLQSLQHFHTFSTVSLHELVRAVEKEFHSPHRKSEYTCHIAYELLEENSCWYNSYVWSKLLEESFPGFVYNKLYSGYIAWAEAHTVCIVDADYKFRHSLRKPGNPWTELGNEIELRKNLFHKLLQQPDRILVIPRQSSV